MSARIYDRRVRHQAKCRRCGSPAVWYYGPVSSWRNPVDQDRRNAFCDDCVPRGCCCQREDGTGLMYRDRRWRELPCCEFEYEPQGLYLTQGMHLLFLSYGVRRYPYRISQKRIQRDRIARRQLLRRKTFPGSYHRDIPELDANH